MLRLVLTIAVVILASGLLPTSAAAQGGGNRAALVVSNGLGQPQTRCVSFSEASISGDELLNRSGLAVIMDYNAGLGGAVCSIAGYGCAFPTQDCFCKCQGRTCEYWAYYHSTGSAWAYSQVGASSYQVTNGALEGWSWGPGTFGTAGTLPPAVTFGQICTPPTATPSPTRTATVSPTPSRTPTPSATAPSSSAGNTPLPNQPDVVFESDTSDLAPGACTVLRWVTWNAQQVTLDGTSVAAQDRREVCLQASQRFVLAATNAAGTVRREILLSVSGSHTQPPASVTPVATPLPTPSRSASLMPSAEPGRNTVVPAPIPLPTSIPPTQSAAEGRLLLAGAQAQAAALPSPPLPLSTGVPTPGPTPTARLIATPPPTRPLARQPIAPDGPTATPILMARVAAGNSPASPGQPISVVERSAARPDRSFRMAFLPGYAIYLLMAATLVGMGTVVVRRRQKA